MSEQKQKTALDLTEEAPLVINRVSRRKDGGVDITIPLNNEQTYILLEFAIMALTAQGLVVIQEQVISDDNESPEETPAVSH